MYLDTSWGKVFYEFCEGKNPIIFIHGAGCNIKVWEEVINRISGKVPYLLIDLPLHGKSRVDEDILTRLNSISDYGDFILEIIDKLSLSEFLVCGHSMGGAISLDLLARKDTRIKGGIIVSSGAVLRVNPVLFEGLKSNPEDTLSKVSRLAIAKDAPNELFIRVFELFSSADLKVVYRDFLLCDRFDLRNKLEEIEVPVLIVVGSDDVMTLPKLSEELSNKIPKSKLEIVEGKGHMLPLESPDNLAELIVNFWKELTK
ncbi:MAG: alpha/beta fold hydrolase [Thermosulfidibacteraceae bacterium]|jgi:pimeloyl-ACP methyl ester carboxylesterase